MVLSSTKIEHRALNALEAIIDEHRTMDHQFNGNDKEMSWDGYIWLFKINNGQQSKSNFEGRVPVQIKGHNDETIKYLNKNRVTYPVTLDDLNAFATEKGVLYFQIFMKDTTVEIFYSSLFPSKIADYLEKAKKRKNISSISIPFVKLEKNSEKLFEIVKQFNAEAIKQGSVYTPIVQDRIRIDDLDKVKTVNLSVVGASNSYDALLRLSSGDICIYGKTEGDKYFRPIEWVDQTKFVVGHDVKQSISIGGEEFYHEYRCVADSEGGMVIIPSPNLELRITEKKFNFKIVSPIAQLSVDARFLLMLKEAKSYSIAGHIFHISDVSLSNGFEEKLRYIVDLNSTLEMIGLKLDKPISSYSDLEHRQLVRLVNLRNGAYNQQLSEEYSKYLWKFGEKIVPLLIIKANDHVTLVNTVYTNQYAIYLPNEKTGDQRGYMMPLFVYQDAETLSNLYYYDYEALQGQLDNCEVNDVTSGALIECVLLMINVFDLCKNEHFLSLADHLLSRLKDVVEEAVYSLNSLQIKKRLSPLDKDDYAILERIQIDDPQVLFGKNVLFGNREEASRCFNMMSAEDQEKYKTYPIFNLYQML